MKASLAAFALDAAVLLAARAELAEYLEIEIEVRVVAAALLRVDSDRACAAREAEKKEFCAARDDEE